MSADFGPSPVNSSSRALGCPVGSVRTCSKLRYLSWSSRETSTILRAFNLCRLAGLMNFAMAFGSALESVRGSIAKLRSSLANAASMFFSLVFCEGSCRSVS